MIAVGRRSVGIVVIGRNEGERLRASLESVQGLGSPVIYVDSGSSDGSPERAQALCDGIVELDPAPLFSAARARNEGTAALLAAHPGLESVQFLDGDCTLISGWLDAAVEALASNAQRGVVFGPLHERHPNASVYNRLCAIEWRSPPGDLTNYGALGGIMMVRVSVFRAVGGFNAQVIAGEDAEFGLRVGAAGFLVTKIDVPMATHDADIYHFHQWWQRAVRSGHAIGQRFSLHGKDPSRDCARERRSVLLWAGALPFAIFAAAPFTNGFSLLLAVGYVFLAHRIARYRRGQGDDRADARLYAAFLVLGKFAQGLGLLKFHLNRVHKHYRIIEYK